MPVFRMARITHSLLSSGMVVPERTTWGKVRNFCENLEEMLTAKVEALTSAIVLLAPTGGRHVHAGPRRHRQASIGQRAHSPEGREEEKNQEEQSQEGESRAPFDDERPRSWSEIFWAQPERFLCRR